MIAQGGQVHYAVTAADAQDLILDICRKLKARTVTKGKSMVAEEIGLNDFLQQHGITPVETDLGEYIIQLRHELPSHIIAPAVHLTKAQVEQDFRRVHTHLPHDRNLVEPESLLAEARAVLREKFLAADVGITGANFLVAETGSAVIVTNEGNGDLTQTLPKAHIVLASIEKLVPTLEDLSQLLRVLARSATGQEMSVYTTLSCGPRRPGDPDGPGEFHVVLLDNGRSVDAGRRLSRDAALHPLRRLHEPLPGLSRGRRPRLWMGLSGPHGSGADAELDRHRQGREPAQRLDVLRALRRGLPGAHSVAADDALMARARIRAASVARHRPRRSRLLGILCRRPWLYRLSTAMAARLLARLGRTRGRFTWLPLASGWTRYRDFPAPQGATFQAQWKQPPGGARAGDMPALPSDAAEGAAMTSRDLILATVRRALGVTGTEAPRRFAVEARLAAHPAGVVPKRGQLPAAERLDLFIRMATAAAATVERVATPEDIPAAVATFLRRHNLAAGDPPRRRSRCWRQGPVGPGRKL